MKPALRLAGLSALVGVACGASAALFLALLDRATHWRTLHPSVVFALPIAGLAIGWVYERIGSSVLGGTNLVIDTIHDGGPEIPPRMAPLVLIGTVLTHLFGGSAGREGTAVQMGASLADALAQRTNVEASERRQLLAAGVAGGFGAVFGTPVAGAVFGMEFVVLGQLEYPALLPALIAAFVGDAVCRGLGIVHASYPLVAAHPLTLVLLCKWGVFAVAVAAITVAFIELTHAIKRWTTARIGRLPLRMACGGAAIVALWSLIGSDTYLGLGVPVIVQSFTDPALFLGTSLFKMAFTAVTLGTGFLGGEVTPLFFIGATLGNALARLLSLPLDLGAGVGLAAVFGAAANAPLALSVMAVELMGRQLFPHVVLVSVLACALSGHRSIYPAQRVRRTKRGRRLGTPARVSELSAPRRPEPPRA